MWKEAKKYSIFTVALIAIFFIFPSLTKASTVFDDDFESYSVGNWTPSAGSLSAGLGGCTRTPQVTTAQAHTGTKSLLIDRTGSGANCTFRDWVVGTDLPDTTPVIFSFWARSDSWVASSGLPGVRDDGSGSMCGWASTGGNITLGGGTAVSGGTSLSTNTWHQFELELDQTNDTCRGRINGGTWSSTEAVSSTRVADAYRIGGTPGSNVNLYIDDIELLNSSLGDPRDTPTCTDAGNLVASYQLDGATYIHPICVTNINQDDYASEVMDYEYELRLDADDSVVYDFSLDDRVSFCDALAGDPYCGTLIPQSQGYTFQPGTYYFAMRVYVQSSATWSAWAETSVFTVTPYNFGDGTISGEIQNTWGGGYGSISDLIATYPDHDTTYGACDWWGSTAGDGLSCLWSWVSFAMWPEVSEFGSLVGTSLGIMLTRWPFSYITVPIYAVEAGMQNGATATCPLPSFFGSSFLGTTIDAYSPCDTIESIGLDSIVTGQVQTWLMVGLWLNFILLWISMTVAFFHLKG